MVYRRLLQDDFDRLAPVLRKLHDAQAGVRARGSVSVRHESRWLARLFGFPRAGDDIPLELAVESVAEGETWTRKFAGDILRSVQRAAEDGLMIEDMGQLRLKLRVFADGEDLRLESQSATFWTLPVPLRVKAVERGLSGNRWEFEVEVAPVGAYRGVMELLP
jgi:hypothetical protein